MEFNLAQVFTAVAGAKPDRGCIVWGDRRFTYGEVDERTDRLAQVLAGRGLRRRSTRDGLAGHESHQDHLGLMLYNGNEYLEGMIGAIKAGVASFNINYRYVAEELRYLLNDSGARGLVYHAQFAPTLAEVLGELPQVEVLIQVADSSGHGLLPGAIDYEDALAAAPDGPPDVDRSPDDLYILYTGGTTGMPKGVLWRSHDIFVGAMGGRPFGQSEVFADLDAVVAASVDGGGAMMTTAPLMHGAAQWSAFSTFAGGNTVVMPHDTTRLDPVDVWQTVERERVLILQIVGDAFARPLIEELERGSYDISSLIVMISGGAALNSSLKERFLELAPNAVVVDAVGSSETGAQMGHTSVKGAASTGEFTPGPDTLVVSEDLSSVLEAGHEGNGWLAQTGYMPLGYLGDADKTARTFPFIDGRRYAVPGDRAVCRADGIIELLGRDSVTINSGGEKIFAEEVEQALAHHPDVYDVVVCGRPSERWGQEVVALVQLQPDAQATDDDLLDECAKHLARYKFPKTIVHVDQLVRSPSGKADYRWAKQTALEHRGEG